MAQPIARLFAEIGADTTKLQKGLAEGKTGLEKMSGAFQALTGISLTSVTAIAAVGAVIKAASDFAKQAVVETVAYAEQVRDLGRISGTSAEETSKLIQVADDLKVSYETLTMAARTAAQKGISITTEALAKLSDQYRALPDAADKSKFALDNFGRAGLEMTKILEMGGDAIRKMAAEQSGGLILSEKQVKAARDLEIAQDKLNDEFSAFKTTLGAAVIPAIAKFLEGINDLINKENELKNKQGQATKAVIDAKGAYQDYIGAQVDVLEQEKKMSAATAEREKSLWKLKEQYGVLTKAEIAEMLALGKINDETADALVYTSEYAKELDDLAERRGWYTTGQYDLAKAIAENNKQLAAAPPRMDDYRESADELAERLKEVKSDMDKMNETIKTSAERAFPDATLKMEDFTKAVLEPLTGNAYKDMANELIGVNEKLFDFWWRLEDAKKQLKDGLITYEQYKQVVRDLKGELVDITSQDFLLKLRADFTDWERALGVAERLRSESGLFTNNGALIWTQPPGATVAPSPLPTFGNGGQVSGSGGREAGGGSFVIPAGYPDTYPLGRGQYGATGERVTVTPAGNTAAGAGAAQVNINVNGQVDEERLARRVARIIQGRQ